MDTPTETPTAPPGDEGHIESQNPYAPPVEAGGAAFAYGADPRGLPAEMITIVSQLSWWLRFLSMTYYIGCGLMVLMVVALAVMGQSLPGVPQTLLFALLVMLGIFAVFGVLAATWLMQAGGHFNSGVRFDDMGRLFQGFRSLKLYLIVYLIYAGINLLIQFVPLGWLGMNS